ncbi:GNAT family N-acetyltransferase [Promicromonospora sp. NPDC057138]|uniref:GNAT family N-acetyltransferase n=1 Tax=Promicromonospora sp. NPDC057138 TaxID=3346031 RepID=UPI003633A9A1
MTVSISEPDVDDLSGIISTLGEWQDDAAPVQLHPGDVGWYWRFGAQATAAAVRTWSRDGRVLAVGLLDGARILRLTTAPDVRRDEELARQLVTDVTTPEHGVLPDGAVNIEAPPGALVSDLLADEGWGTDAPFTPLRRDLTAPVEDAGVRVEVVGPDRVSEHTAVLRAAFDGSTFTDERWHAMASGPLYADARCLVAVDGEGEGEGDGDGKVVGAITVWSAGPGRPGLIEPLGVHPDHRGHGYGRAVTVAGAAALRELGSSSALVITESTRPAAVATYVSAGFELLPERHDRRRAG